MRAPGLALAATLLAVPVAAEEEQLCLTVEAGEGSSLGSPVMVRNGITSGLIEIVSVDECDTEPVAMTDEDGQDALLGDATD